MLRGSDNAAGTALDPLPRLQKGSWPRDARGMDVNGDGPVGPHCVVSPSVAPRYKDNVGAGLTEVRGAFEFLLRC